MRGGGATCTGGWWPSALVGGGCTVQNGGNFWALALFAGAVGVLVLHVGLKKDAQGCWEDVYAMLEAGVQPCWRGGHCAGCTPRYCVLYGTVPVCGRYSIIFCIVLCSELCNV